MGQYKMNNYKIDEQVNHFLGPHYPYYNIGKILILDTDVAFFRVLNFRYLKTIPGSNAIK